MRSLHLPHRKRILEKRRLLRAGWFRIARHARQAHPELTDAERVAVVLHGGRDRLDRDASRAAPRYVCWAHLPRHGRCRGVYVIEEDATGRVLTIITAFPERP